MPPTLARLTQRRRPHQCGGGRVQRGAGVGSRRGLRPDERRPRRGSRPPGRVRAPPGLSRRRGDLASSPGSPSASGSRRSTRPGLCPCRREGLGHSRTSSGRSPAGEISFDKVRVLADVATPETERELCDQAKECSVRELADIARSAAELARTSSPSRGALSTMVASCASTTAPHHVAPSCRPTPTPRPRPASRPWSKRSPLRARHRWDQRRCDALLELIHSSVPGSGGPPTATTTSPYVVVAHVPLAALVEDSGEESVLAGELEHGGLIDRETVRRIACDATIVVAARRRRRAHHVRGPGPTFPERRPAPRGHAPGPTLSLPGLHQRDLHQCPPHRAVETRGRPTSTIWPCSACTTMAWCTRKGWTMSGNANEELTFIGPSGRVMTSRPSPLWTRVTAGPRSGPSG